MLQRLARLSTDGVVSFVSQPERDAVSGKLYNSLFVLGRDGVLGRHRKLHPTPGSEAWASAGVLSEPVIVEGIPVGLLICADAYPTQPAHRLRDAGAQLLRSAAAWWPANGVLTGSGRREQSTAGYRLLSATAAVAAMSR